MSQNISILSKNDLTAEEKQIYNTYLITSRKAKQKPFKIRHNFADLKDETYISVKKLGAFFKNNSNISLYDFFQAPYEVYSKTEYFDLSFYCTRKAIVAYSQYMRQKETQDADSEFCINECKTALANIYKYCQSNSISLAQYKSSGGIPPFLVQLKEHKINFYVLHGLDIDKNVRSIEKQLLDFYCRDFYNLYKTTRIKFVASSRLKEVIRNGLEIIEKKLLIFNKPNP